MAPEALDSARSRIGHIGRRSVHKEPNVFRDTALITALIVERPMCIRCIAQKTTLSEAAAHTALEAIRRAIAVKCAPVAACPWCGSSARLFCVTRPE
jgi:hypothetical protein